MIRGDRGGEDRAHVRADVPAHSSVRDRHDRGAVAGRLTPCLRWSTNLRLLMRASGGSSRCGRWRLLFVLAVALSVVGAPGAALADPVLTTVGPPAATGEGPWAIAFAPSGRLVATANYHADSLSVLSVSAGGVLTPVGSPASTGDGPDSVAFSPDGRLLAATNGFPLSVSMFQVSSGGLLDLGRPPSPDRCRLLGVGGVQSGWATARDCQRT